MSVRPERLTADHPLPLVVFFIGMRINHMHRPDKWLPVARAMPRMISELTADPDSGFLGAEVLRHGLRTIAMLQYWTDFEKLEAYAQARDKRHWPAFNKAVGSDGNVGIFHETYVVAAGAQETVYANMPPFGLGRATGLVSATGSRQAARSRMSAVPEG
jgi:hypothetical protein